MPRTDVGPACALLVLMTLAAAGGPSQAAEPAPSWGSAFRPQVLPAQASMAGAAAAASAPASPDAAPPGLRVVLTGSARAVAWIDGRMVHVGDVLEGGLRVTQIDRQGVQLLGEDGTKQRMAVHPSVLKTPPRIGSKGERE